MSHDRLIAAQVKLKVAQLRAGKTAAAVKRLEAALATARQDYADKAEFVRKCQIRDECVAKLKALEDQLLTLQSGEC